MCIYKNTNTAIPIHKITFIAASSILRHFVGKMDVPHVPNVVVIFPFLRGTRDKAH